MKQMVTNHLSATALQICSVGCPRGNIFSEFMSLFALDQSHFWVVKSPVQGNGKTSILMISILSPSHWDHGVHVCVFGVGAHVCVHMCAYMHRIQL